MEIERKYLISILPENLGTFPSSEIRQGYLAESRSGTEVRVRQKGDNYSLTVKSGAGRQRSEVELALSPQQFEMLWPLTEGFRVFKKRIDIPFQEFTIELDIYHDNLEGLVTAEVEFQTLEISRSFTPPNWFSREITDDLRYTNRTLAQSGIPSDG